MKHSVWLGIVMMVLLSLVGCGPTTAVPTPTPFASTDLQIRALPGEPIPVSLAYLAENPTFFEGATLQITGQYERLPQLVCDRDPHLPPYSWGLTNDNVLALAGGMDSALRSLAPDGLTVTVEGTWLRWTGPIGCGKNAPVKEIWYLAVARILEPSPLLRVTLTPAGLADGGPVEGPAVEVTDSAQGEPQPGATAVPTTQPLNPTATLPQPTTIPTAEPIPPTATFLPTATTGVVTATGVATGTTTTPTTVTPTPGTSTPTTTPNPQQTRTPNPTATAATVATATPTTSDPLNDALPQGELDYRDLALEPLAGSTIHRWEFFTEEPDSGTESRVTIMVAPGSPTADLTLAIYDASGTAVITDANTAGPGRVERIDNFNLDAEADYTLLISTVDGSATDYAVMIQDASDAFTISFEGLLTPGDTVSGNLAEENDHFWFFNTTQDNPFTVEVVPNTATADVYLELYDPTGARIDSFETGGQGESETIDHTPTSTGLYSVRIGEYSYGTMAYTVTFTVP